MTTSPPRARQVAPALLVVLSLADLLMTAAAAQGADVTTIPSQARKRATRRIGRSTARVEGRSRPARMHRCVLRKPLASQVGQAVAL